MLIDFLVKLDDSIVGRYRTVIRNIKSMSNSYYDSFLDMLEATIKRMLELNEIEYDKSKTCGYIIKEDVVKDFFLNRVRLDDFTFSKINDYIKKVNDHKHKKEKSVKVETVINQMLTYYNLISSYLLFSDNIILPDYEAEYYVSIFGVTEKENRQLKAESERLKNEIENLSLDNKLSKENEAAFQSIISVRELELLSLDEQNHELQNQISRLKDIKLNSMEEKLNKTIDLLNNLTESVIESRAIGIAVGETIIGGDITQTEYMKKAREVIKNGK